MFIIGIDPHKGSHTAAVLNRSETVIGELRVSADRRQRDRLLEFAADFRPRTRAYVSTKKSRSYEQRMEQFRLVCGVAQARTQ